MAARARPVIRAAAIVTGDIGSAFDAPNLFATSLPRKRESRATAPPFAPDPAFAQGNRI
jgi:hypothetical protein